MPYKSPPKCITYKKYMYAHRIEEAALQTPHEPHIVFAPGGLLFVGEFTVDFMVFKVCIETH